MERILKVLNIGKEEEPSIKKTISIKLSLHKDCQGQERKHSWNNQQVIVMMTFKVHQDIIFPWMFIRQLDLLLIRSYLIIERCLDLVDTLKMQYRMKHCTETICHKGH